MEIFKTLYLFLFNQVTDAIDAMQEHNYGTAETLLRRAQLECEEKFVAQCDSVEQK